ncbi:MAG: preprotein translocase subunit SecE [Bacillota bacterium]|nr:preprotein translocase subunit SecE [Bacillota bacterium]
MANQPAVAPTRSKSIGKYVRSSRAELKKVHWPTRDELKNHTAVVVVVCLMATLALWAIDSVFGLGLNLVIR